MTERINLTERTIDNIIGLFCYESEHGELKGEDKQRAEGLIKQIQDDYETIELLTKSELSDLPLLKVVGEQRIEINNLKKKLGKIESWFFKINHKSSLDRQLELKKILEGEE